jgi:hypothetical protein
MDAPTTEPVVKWSYGPRWGRDVAICTVKLGGRYEQWASKSIYISDAEREDVPKELTAKLRRTIRLFGVMEEDDDE